MKNLPTNLLNFLNASPPPTDYGRADLFQIALLNGITFRTTSFQTDFVYGGNTYYASQYGAWERGSVTSEASFDLRANDMVLKAYIPSAVAFPGLAVPMMSGVPIGLFDGAQVTVYTAYWAEGEQPNATRGVETKFVGVIMNFKNAGRSVVEFTVGDYLYLLNLKTPPKLIQASCRHTLFDANCTLNKNSYAANKAVASGSTTQLVVLSSALAYSPPYYTQGYLLMTSGLNNGLMFSIKQQLSTTNLLLAGKMPLALAIGDSLTVYAGCDKTQATCKARFNNLVNFGGQPYVPNPEHAI